MKSIKTLLFCMLAAVSSVKESSAQNIAINTTGNAAADAAMLDVSSTTKGVLIPRVSLTSTAVYAPITGTAVTSLLVYNDATVGTGTLVTDVSPGFYYWDVAAAKWIAVAGNNGKDWSLLGNAGTVDGTNFLGTTDDIPFTIRVNNVLAGRIDNATGAKFNTSLGYLAGNAWTGAGINNAAFGYNALLVNSTGVQNTAMGSLALAAMTNNGSATAVGFKALTLNTQTNNTAVGSEALSTNTTGAYLTAVGQNALKLNTGDRNTAVGTWSLLNNAAGGYNTAVGSESMRMNTTGTNNTAIGEGSLFANTDGVGNTALGNAALSNTSGNTGAFDGNTAVGVAALFQNRAGGKAVAVGLRSQYNANVTTTAYDNTNTTVGYRTMFGKSGVGFSTTGLNNTAIGFESFYANTQQILGGDNTAVGHRSLYSNNAAGHNTAIGSLALYTQNYTNGVVAWSTSNVAIGDSALYTNNPTSSVNGYRNTAVGSQALKANTTGSYNTAVGYKALNSSTATANVALGTNALMANISGNGNVAVGKDALALTTGAFSTGLGYSALAAQTSGLYNVAVGSSAMQALQTGNFNLAVGTNALQALNTTSYNTALGYGAGFSSATGVSNTFLGALAGYWSLGDGNTCLGFDAGLGVTGVSTYAHNTLVGFESGFTSKGGGDNIAVGYQAMKFNTYGEKNIAIGTKALYNQTFENSSTLWALWNIAIGDEALYSNQPSDNLNGKLNTAIGGYAMRENTTGGWNTALGYQAMKANTTGIQNTALGLNTLLSAVYQNNNTAVGYGALTSNVGDGATATGQNTVVGAQAMLLSTTGVQNTAIGMNALGQITTGNGNVAIGYHAGYNQTATPTSNKFFLDNINRGNAAAELSTSMMYGIFGATVATQSLTINAQTFISGSLNVASSYLKFSGAGVSGPGQSVLTAGSKFQLYDANANHEIGIESGGMWFKSDGQFRFYDNTGPTARVIIEATGNVGIGVANPGYQLEIAGGAAIASTTLSWFVSGATGSTITRTAVTPIVDLKTANAIWAVGGFYSTSDKRAKKNISSISSSASLALVGSLRPVIYSWIDPNKSGHKFESGFIAQEIEDVLPEAINTNIEVIPNIMELVEKKSFENNLLRFELKESGKVMVGDKLKVITEDGREYKWVVESLYANEVVLSVEEGAKPSGKLFIYGKEVKDFKTVDYDKVFTVGISAIQELAKQNERQQSIIDDLKNKNEVQDQNIQALKEEIAKIKTYIPSQASK